MTNREKALEEALRKMNEVLDYYRGESAWTPTLGVNVNAFDLERILASLPAQSTETDALDRDKVWASWRDSYPIHTAQAAFNAGWDAKPVAPASSETGLRGGRTLEQLHKSYNVLAYVYGQAHVNDPAYLVNLNDLRAAALQPPAPSVKPEGWLTREQVENLAALLTDPAVQAICRMALYALQQATPKVYGCPACGTGMEVDESAKPSAPSAWQPMETAPKDGTSVMLWDADRESVSIAFWLGAQERWVSPYDASPDTPTAWMPLPTPPSSDEASR